MSKPEHQELLVKCISQNLEVQVTSVFAPIIQTIASAIEVATDNNQTSAYWLSNLALLRCLLQRRFTSATIPCKSMIGLACVLSLKGYMGGRVVLSSLSRQREVEAKYPALLFKQQLTALLEKMYGMIRDNLKKEISPLLELCIKAQRKKFPQQALTAYWQSIVERLSSYLILMKANIVPPFLVSKIYIQIFSFINVELFNRHKDFCIIKLCSLLLRRECCSFSNGEYVKAGLDELKQWCIEATDEYVGSAWDELRHIREAVSFLVIRKKQEKTLEELTREICPVLSIAQLYRISTMYWDDKYVSYTHDHGVSSDVLKKMRRVMDLTVTEESNNIFGRSFLLEDDSSIPFTVEDISKSMQELDVNDFELPQLIHENAGFSFLLTRGEGSPL
ncbi:unnamed protein product [Thlaspi arvense]|uniref:Dilute domain-containing protein n=1 Tax=Thlaspi arvense TaxID=13288 RepID=A0AAU9SSP7_THLAR|nr:unnamed protein product [Thlaspi arvense]